MTNLQEILASLLDRLVSEVGKVPGLDEEFRRARTEFFGPRKPEPISVARFEEWFLFERRSPRLGDAPAFVALAARIQPRVSAPIQELLDELAANSYGVFELVSEEGEVSARDLLSERQLSLDPEQAELLEGAMDEASVIVGRLFPSGRGSYLFGRGAVAVGGGVAKALRGDLAMPGKDRRQRISQLQMERLLFFDVGAPERSEGDPAESEPIERIEAEVDQWLRESVTDGFGIEDLRERFLKSPTIDEAVEPTLEELAFETDADLDLGRRLLPSYYRALHGRKRAPKPEVSAAARADALRAKASEPCACGSERSYGDCCLPRDAVARFEAGRARGDQLDHLIAELESAMGVDADGDEDDGDESLSPPAAIAPMVEEYLWECERLGAPRSERDAGFLRALASSLDGGPGAPAELADVLPLHWERFVSFDRYRQEVPPSEETIASDLDVAAAFATWVRDEQGVDWFGYLTPILDRERAMAPRVARANGLLEGGEWRRRTDAFSITRVTLRGGAHEVEIESIGKPAMRGTVSLPVELATHLEPGDCVVIVSEETPSREGGRSASGGGEPASSSRRSAPLPMGWEKTVSARLLRILPSGARAFLESAATSQE